jgi:type IV pilus assembly protein PilF
MRLRKFLFISLSLIAAISLSSCAMTQKSKKKEKSDLYFELGTAHLQQGNYPAALRALLASEQLDPSNPYTQNNLGITYLAREKYDLAEAHFKRALSLRSDYTDARNNLGRLYLDVGLYDKAVRELEITAADLTYDSPEKSWANLGEAYFFSGKYKRAQGAFLNSLKHRAGNCLTMNYYGRTLFELMEYTTAAEALDQAIQACEKSKFVEPHFYSAMSFYKLGEVEKARARFEEVTTLYPKSSYATKSKEMLELMK